MIYYEVWTPGNGPTEEEFISLNIPWGHVYADYGAGYIFCCRGDEKLKEKLQNFPNWRVKVASSLDTNSWGESYYSVLEKAEQQFKNSQHPCEK